MTVHAKKRRQRKHTADITLTKRQIELLHSILDSFVEGRAGRSKDAGAGNENSIGYRQEDRFAVVLFDKLITAQRSIERNELMDRRIAKVREALLK